MKRVIVEDAPTRHGGSALGALDRLTRRAELEYKALLVVTAMLERDAGERASAALPAKLLAAANSRRALMPADEMLLSPTPPDEAMVHETKRRVTKPARTGAKAAAIREKGKTHITKGRLALFLLEHMAQDRYIGLAKIHEQLLKAGNPPIKGGGPGLNAVVGGSLQARGYVQRGKEGGYRLLSKGAKYAVKLRAALHTAGEIAHDSYFLPSDYVYQPKKRAVTR